MTINSGARTSGGDSRCSQAQVHGHLRSHGQQIVLESLLHQTLLLLCQTGHLPLRPFPCACLQLLSELLQRGGSGQTSHLLLTKGQRHGGSSCHDRGGQIICKKKLKRSKNSGLLAICPQYSLACALPKTIRGFQKLIGRYQNIVV